MRREERDRVVWMNFRNGVFSNRSLYSFLEPMHVIPSLWPLFGIHESNQKWYFFFYLGSELWQSVDLGSTSKERAFNGEQMFPSQKWSGFNRSPSPSLREGKCTMIAFFLFVWHCRGPSFYDQRDSFKLTWLLWGKEK